MNKAKESKQIIKARKKLQKQMTAEKKRLNQTAIHQMKKAIQIWIDRHQSERVQLSERPVELFDENRHSAKTKSKHVSQLLKAIKKEAMLSKSFKPLIGRIKK
ncbi:MAG: hypothetical protein WB791_08005 [Waddliaceae bacterium]